MTQAQDFIAYLRDHVSPEVSYSTSDAPCNDIPARCNMTCSGCADCSGYVSDGAVHVGVTLPRRCLVSGDFYQMCSNAGTLMRLTDGLERPGSLLFRGINGMEHIAVNVGGGYQIAAHGHTITPQVGILPVGNLGSWTPLAGWLPGLHDDVWPPIIVPPPKPKVYPMYAPPLGPIAAVWQDSAGRVLAAAAPNGDVYAFAVPFRPWPNKAHDFAGRSVARIGQANHVRDEHGHLKYPALPDNRYAITATTGETYAP